MDIKAAFTKLHYDLRNNEAIQIIENRNSFASINQDKYLKRIEMKIGQLIPKEMRDYAMLTYSNSMNYHYSINDIPTGQGAWNLIEMFHFILKKPTLTSVINEEDKALVFFDQPKIDEDVASAYIWGTGVGYFPGKVYLYKKGVLVETSLSFVEYLENIIHCMGALHWPLLFSSVDADHHSFEYEFMKLNQSYSHLKELFPNRDLTIFEKQLKKKGLR